MYSEQDLRYAAELRDEIHGEALARVKALYPCADNVVDHYSANEYFQQVWDYPGKWYTAVSIPQGEGSRETFIDTIVRQTLEYYKKSGADYTDDPSEENDDIEYEYFLGFEGDEKTGLWSVFARVSVDRETQKVTFLDYKTPEGERMENPIKPISFA